jgi:tetratricopeptide (TPR) repeat protein
MKTLTLSEAIREITLATRRLGENERRPYCFVVGAGISYPPVPLAASVERHCVEESESIGGIIPPLSDAPIARYSHWFSLAYPHAIHRQKYLRSLIEGRPISQANLRLAHVLSSRRIATIGITPNFDDFLSRALQLLGERDYRVCDHPATVERIDPESQDLQIIHVHGNYWFYDQCNLAAEIGSRAEASSDSAFSMLGLMDRIFSNRAPIVIGYSGWEGDVIMTALKRRLAYDRRLPYRMYWFLYSAAATSTLPTWLRQHPDVYFVVPLEMSTAGRSPLPHHEPSGTVSDELVERSSFMRVEANLASGEEAILPAVRVFDELIRMLDLEAPAITKDPFQFFADSISASLSLDDSAGDRSDIYALRSIVSRLEHARETAVEAESSLEEIRNALRRSRYEEVVEIATEIDLVTFDRSQAYDAARMVTFAASNLMHDNLERAGQGYILAVELLQRGELTTLADEERALLALSMEGLTGVYRSLNRPGDAFKVCDDAIQEFQTYTTIGVQEVLARIYTTRTFILGELDRDQENGEAYRTLYNTFKDSAHPDAKASAAWGLLMLGLWCAEYEDLQRAAEVFANVVEEFGTTEHDRIRGWVIGAITYRAHALTDLGLLTEALTELDDGIALYSESSPSQVVRRLEMLQTRGMILIRLGRSSEAISTLNTLIQVGGDDPEAQKAVGTAMVRKAHILAETRQFDDAIIVVTTFAQRFGQDEDVADLMLTDLQSLAEGGSPPHGIKQFCETVQRVMRAHHG